MVSDKENKIKEVISLMVLYGLSLSDVEKSLSAGRQVDEGKGSIVTVIFAYIGGILIFSGIAAFINLIWGDLGSGARVIVTLGSGFIVYLMAVVSAKDMQKTKITTALFVISSVLQPTGLLVMLDEYSTGGDPRHGAMFVCGYMLLQLIPTFIARGNGVLAFMSVFFGASLFALIFDVMGMNEWLAAIVIGSSLMFLSKAIDKTIYRAMTPLWYFIGSLSVLLGVWDWMDNSAIEPLFVAFCAGFIYLAIILKSRTVMFNSCVAILSYISWYTFEYFAGSFGWPIALIVTGLLFIGVSSYALKLSKKCISS